MLVDMLWELVDIKRITKEYHMQTYLVTWIAFTTGRAYPPNFTLRREQEIECKSEQPDSKYDCFDSTNAASVTSQTHLINFKPGALQVKAPALCLRKANCSVN